MSGHDKKPRASRQGVKDNKSPIATPPAARLQRSKNNEHAEENTASSKAKPAAAAGGGGGGGVGNSNSSDEEMEDNAKDRKIAALEQEIQKMKDDFQWEQASLSHKLASETESASIWQTKYSTLNQTFLQTDTELRMLRTEMGGMAQQREERERDIKTRISSLMLDRDSFREAYNEVLAEGKVKEEVIAVLQSQIRGLKSFVSANSKMDEQVTDEAFGERMQRLGNGLQNWVISNFRRAKVDPEKANDETKQTLVRLVPTYEGLVNSCKIHFIQSLVSRLLVESVFQEYFIGLPNEKQAELKRVENFLSTLGSAESMNQWRSTTLAILRKEAPQKLQDETTIVVEKFIQQINSIMDSITDVQTSEARDQSLRGLVTGSIELSRLLRAQRAEFTVTMPLIEDHQRAMFDDGSMEDISGEDEDTLHEREIRCVTFPGILKAGDENGEQGHLRNVVAKIRVLCAPD